MNWPKCPACGTVLVPSGKFDVCPKTTCKHYGKEPPCESGSSST